ncbi:MAG: hypothetical protein AAF203_06620, partial [Pseudomonadota bacterium]
MNRVLLALFVLFAVQFQTKAAVWQHDTSLEWDETWQERYSQWVETSVKAGFFKKMGSPFADVKMDCADAYYALQAYFAREHKLPFSVEHGKVTNLMTRFDGFSNPDVRLAKFMNYLRGHYGTEALVHKDTFPPALKEVAPGDIFMWKIGKAGNFTRHTYIIQSINDDGTFDVIYSTQANAAKNGPLKVKKGYMFKKRPKHRGGDRNRWGFRRMKPAQYADWDQESVPGANFEQYDLAEKLSTTDFFFHIRKLFQTVSQTPQQMVQKAFTSLCSALQGRIEIVNNAQEELKATGGACMNFAKYDAHSTPSRDSGLMQDYTNFEYILEQLESAGEIDEVSEPLLSNS